jgi:glycosyltransferase involved in cell wall biosynthesis
MRICVITAGHLSTCPRMVKAAGALAEAGHAVRIVSTQFLEWAAAADGAATNCPWRAVDYRRHTAPAMYWSTGVRFHAARQWTRLAGAGGVSLATLAAVHGRAAHDLLKLALAEPADLFYAGTCGGLAIAALAARKTGKPYGLDLEDFHDGEFERDVLREVLPDAAFVTAGSAAIATEYERWFGIPALPIHNTFPLPVVAPQEEPPGNGMLRLYWFSQTIGAGRGLEEVVRAAGIAGIRAELHLRGSARPEYVGKLQALIGEVRARMTVEVHAPAPPDQMVELCFPYDVGVSAEEARDANRELCLSNKALTYVVAGLPVVLTETAGQRDLAGDLGEGALRYQPGDVQTLANGLRRWAEDRGALRRARAAAWQAAQRRWNWDHRAEKGALIQAVEGAVR